MTGSSPRDAKSDARSRLEPLTDDVLHRVAVYIAVGLVANCVILAASNVGFERHTWWGWLLIGVPLTWLGFLGAVALTFGALRIGVGAARWGLWLTPQIWHVIAKGISFLRAGYPQGVPATDTFPLLAVLAPRVVR
jgi:hypothetical protein